MLGLFLASLLPDYVLPSFWLRFFPLLRKLAVHRYGRGSLHCYKKTSIISVIRLIVADTGATVRLIFTM